MNILISAVRISGFRGLENLEVKLEKTTVLTGMNNSGKTSFLKALQIALGSRQFITHDDFFIKNNKVSKKIVIDLLIEPFDSDFKKNDDFNEDWEMLFTTDRIKTDGVSNFISLRTIITNDELTNNFKFQQFVMQTWPRYCHGDENWYDAENGNKTSFRFEEIPFFYMGAQRDILEDTKLRSSYIGKMLSEINYSQEDIEDIEDKIKSLNEKTVNSSHILSDLKKTLQELDSAMESSEDGIDITPFTKKLRDLSKGLTIYYADGSESFSMEYHGMGTRSWSSLLTLKAFISFLSNNAEAEQTVFFPILAIEEPEAHLHPNAQKKLYSQLNTIKGQTIISTHSPYIAATAELKQIRSFYKNSKVSCGKVNLEKLSPEDIWKIDRQVIDTRGEIFFSKVIVLFEGKTEEQALPILSEKFFKVSPVEMGLDFIGVGGYTNYLPFIRFANDLNIPWLIFSDAEDKAKEHIFKQLDQLGTSQQVEDIVVFLDSGNDFERQLICDGFREEIREVIASFEEYHNEQHRIAKEDKKLAEINSYSDDNLYKIMTSDNHKSKFAPLIAEKIVRSKKNLPPSTIELFNKIKQIYSNEEVQDV